MLGVTRAVGDGGGDQGWGRPGLRVELGLTRAGGDAGSDQGWG